jgi:hypothetical protein
MLDNVILKRILGEGLGGRRPLGEPRNRRKDEARKDAAEWHTAEN